MLCRLVTWEEKSWDPAESSQQNMAGLVDCLAMSSRPSDQQQRRPDGRTSNDSVMARTADGSWPMMLMTVDVETGVQLSIKYCGALFCRHQWTVAQGLYCTLCGIASQCGLACRRWHKTRSYLLVSVTIQAGACRTHWSLSMMVVPQQARRYSSPGEKSQSRGLT